MRGNLAARIDAVKFGSAKPNYRHFTEGIVGFQAERDHDQMKLDSLEVSNLLRALTLGCAALAVTATAALAAPQKKPPISGAGCKPQVSVILKGTVATAPGGGATLPFSLAVTVKHANRFGHAYVTATQPVSITVNADTKIRLAGKKGLTALQAFAVNDRVKVRAQVCKADLAHGATPALTARRVVAHHPAS